MLSRMFLIRVTMFLAATAVTLLPLTEAVAANCGSGSN